MSPLLDRFRLDGRVAIVTGSSRGLGAASAVALAEAGADVVLAARTEATLADVAERVRAHGRRAVTVACDLDDVSSMPALVEAATGELGGLDVVVNNVGGTMPRPLERTSVRVLEEAFHWNVSTAFALTKLAAPVMLERDGGVVVNVTSAIARFAERGFTAYGVAKAALTQLTRQLAADLAPRIRVNAVAPGSIATDALATVLDDDLTAAMLEKTPLRRLGEPDDIALAVLYLASDASSYVTGRVLDVDGGIQYANLALGLPDL